MQLAFFMLALVCIVHLSVTAVLVQLPKPDTGQNSPREMWFIEEVYYAVNTQQNYSVKISLAPRPSNDQNVRSIHVFEFQTFAKLKVIAHCTGQRMHVWNVLFCPSNLC